MIHILCAACDQFVAAYSIDTHTLEEHPEQETIKLKTWPDGEPVIKLDNEFSIFFLGNKDG